MNTKGSSAPGVQVPARALSVTDCNTWTSMLTGANRQYS